MKFTFTGTIPSIILLSIHALIKSFNKHVSVHTMVNPGAGIETDNVCFSLQMMSFRIVHLKLIKSYLPMSLVRFITDPFSFTFHTNYEMKSDETKINNGSKGNEDTIKI